MFFILFVLWASAAAHQSYFQGLELLSDINYSQGFEVIPSCPNEPGQCAQGPYYRLYNPFSTAPNKSATWQMVQWNSHSNMTTNGTFVDDGKSKGILWGNADKRLILFEDSRLQFSIDGFHEYGGKYRAPDTPWACILIQQAIGIAGGAVPLSQVTELRWNLNVQLLYMDQHIQPGYNPDYYAGIFPLYLTVQNLVQGDAEYGKYFWLGLCSYDDRVLMSPLYVNGDNGTAALIYSPAFSNFANVSVHTGNVVHVTGDMMPFVRLGLQAAVDRGYLHSTDLNKYYVGGMNIGWEATGLNNGTIEIGNFSLKQYTAQNPKSYEFENDGDTEGWKVIDHLNQSIDGPRNGWWIFVSTENHFQLISPSLMIDTSVVKKIVIKMLSDSSSENKFKLFWSRNSEGSFDENDSLWIETQNHGRWNEYVLDLSEHMRWIDTVRRIRIDPVQHEYGVQFGIDYIRFAG